MIKQSLQIHADLPVDLSCPDWQAVGEDPHWTGPGVVFLPAAEAKMGKGQRRDRVHDLLQEFVVRNDVQLLSGCQDLMRNPRQFSQHRVL